MDVGTRPSGGGAKKTSVSVVAAGSVWETRMKSDQVKGGITVFTAEKSTGGDDADVAVTTNTPKTVQTTRRKTWRSDNSDGIIRTTPPRLIDKFKSESLKNLDKDLSVAVDGGVKRSPIQARKIRRYESRKGSDVISENGGGIIQKTKPELNRVIKGIDKGNGKAPIDNQLIKVRSNMFDSINTTVETPIELERTKSEPYEQSSDKIVDVKCDDGIKKTPIVVDETRANEICREFGVCQEQLIKTDVSNVAPNYKSSPKILENDDDDEYQEMDGDEFEVEIEIEKKRFDIKEINLPGRKHSKTVIEEKKNYQFHQKRVPNSPIVKRHSIIHQNVTRPTSRLTKPTANIPKSDPIRSSYDFQRIPRTQSRLQSLVDLIMWKDVSRSAFVFGTGTFIIISSSYTKDLNISFISVMSYLSLIYLALMFIYRTIISREVIDVDKSRDGYVVGEEEAIWILKLMLPYINEFLLNLRALFSGHPATTMKLAAVLFVLARCGSSITIWKMEKLGFFGVFVVPKICSLYSTQFALYGNSWIQRIRDAWDSCAHKKGVTLAIFTLVWNLSSVVARIWALFMLFVAVRCYQQSFVMGGDWMQVETVTGDETCPSTIGALRKHGSSQVSILDVNAEE